MKRKLAALVVALLFLSGLVMANGPLSRKQARPSGQSFAISEYGTLLEVFDANGKSRFGKLGGDGFQLSYQAHGKAASVSAVGAKDSKGLQAGQVKADGQSATVTVTTGDKALEISNYFILDEKAKMLIIGRKFRNISAGTVSLLMMREYVDAKLVVGGQPQSTQPNLVQLALGRIKAGNRVADCQPGDCPPGPPLCIQVVCRGLNNYTPPQLITGAGGRPNEITLQWKDSTTLVSQSPGGADTRPTNEVLLIIQVAIQ